MLYVFSDWFEGVRAAACLAMITNLAGAVTLALFTFVPSISKKITKFSSIVLLGMAGTSFIFVLALNKATFYLLLLV